MAASAPAAISAAPTAPGSGRKDRGQAEPKSSLAGENHSLLSLRDEKPSETPPAEDTMHGKLGAPVLVPVAPSASKKRGGGAKKKKPKVKKAKAPAPQCVGYYVDALDKHMLWAEAKIIGANFDTQRIRVHFVGWGKSQDLWTDPMSITTHGRYAPRSKANNPKSWNGDMHIFEDMLGTIKDASIGPNAAPTTVKAVAAPMPAPTPAKRSHKKKVAPKAPSSSKELRKEGISAATGPVKTAAKRTAEKPIKKEDTPAKKRQKVDAPLPTKTALGPKPAAAKPRASRKTGSPSPSKLPFFRELETKDGKPVRVLPQREEGKDDVASMQSFVESCALIWKEQLRALSV